MKYLFMALCCCVVLPLNAQSLYFGYGNNTTSYVYKTSGGETLDIFSSDTGSAFELGVAFELDRRATMNYTAGLSLNAYNATASEVNDFYTWETKYLGLVQGFEYGVFKPVETISFHVNAQLGLHTMVSGTQTTNGLVTDLKDEDDFKGLFIQPGLGAGLSYALDPKIRFSLGYMYATVFQTKSNDESLRFNNHQIRLQLRLSLK